MLVLALDLLGQLLTHVQARLVHRSTVDQRAQVLVDQLIGPDLARDLLVAAAGRDQLVARGHVDAINIRKPYGRRRGREKHFPRAGFARHLDDFAARGAAHDRVVHKHHVLAFEFHADRIQLLPH